MNSKTLIIAGVLFCAACLVVSWFMFGENSFNELKMVEYLNSKYKEDFVVDNVRREGSGLGVAGQLTADARSKNGLTFEVGLYSDGGMYDTYMESLWTREASSEVEKYKRLYDRVNVTKIVIKSYPINKKTKMQETQSALYGSKPTLKQALASDPESVYYGVYSIQSESTIDDRVILESENRIGRLVSEINNTGAGRLNIRYVINIPKDNNRYICDISWGRSESVRRDAKKCFIKSGGLE